MERALELFIILYDKSEVVNIYYNPLTFYGLSHIATKSLNKDRQFEYLTRKGGFGG